MSKSINLPFKPGVPLREQCSHGKTWDEFCLDCRIVWLEHDMEERERQLRRDRAELEQLRAAAEARADCPTCGYVGGEHHHKCATLNQ